MANLGSFYYEEDYEVDGEDYHNSFEYAYEDKMPSFDLNQVLSCGIMIIKQLSHQFFCLFVINIVYHKMRQTAGLPEFLKHLSSSLFGFLSTFIFFTTGNFFVFILVFISYGFLKFLHLMGIDKRRHGFVMIAVQIITIFTCELIEWDSSIWNHLRGSALIISMKAISIAFDAANKKLPKLPPIYEYAGYQLCPANLVLGPFVSFNSYKTFTEKNKFTLKQIFQIILSSIVSFIFIFMSTCFLNYLISDNARFFVTYRDALIFRTSHYFISFMSAAILQISGIESRSNSEWFGFQTTRPLDIELPRSLVTVVISWNIPIHLWIKCYVFENIKQYGKFKAIILTYLISASLHGLNFHLAAVLLSIGIFSYVEVRLRNVMAEILDACINANKCQMDPKSGVCLTKGHENTTKKLWVKIINFSFVIFTIVLLTYLGVLVADTNSIEQQSNGFWLFANLKRWSELNYFGHVIALIWYMIYLILK